MKKLVLATAIAATAAGFTSVAQAEVSANIGVTSNYLWRGASQSGDDASVSGGIDYAHESGFYAGTWIGSLDAGSEVDYYFGFGGEAGDVSYDVGYIYYAYPADGVEGDFSEIYGSGSIQGFTLGFAYTVDGDADDDSAFIEGDTYYYGSYEYGLPQDWTATGTVGHYGFDAEGVEEYTHYGIDLGKGDFTYSISATDQDGPAGNARFVVSWGIGF